MGGVHNHQAHIKAAVPSKLRRVAPSGRHLLRLGHSASEYADAAFEAALTQRHLRLGCGNGHQPAFLGLVTPTEVMHPKLCAEAWRGQRTPVEVDCKACRSTWLLDEGKLSRRLSTGPVKTDVSDVSDAARSRAWS